MHRGLDRIKVRRELTLAASLAAVVLILLGVSSAADGGGVWQRVLYDNFSQGLSPARWARYSGQPGGDPGGLWSPSHVVVRNGLLNLETYRDPHYHNRWVSGGLSDAPGLKQRYGKYEVRFRVDRGHGVAFVALLWPSDNRWPPEIDFAENGGEFNGRNHVSATLHYGSADHQHQTTLPGNFTNWHTLGVQWTPGKIQYFVDGRVWATMSGRDVPAQRMELDMQTQAGTCGVAYAPCPNAATPRYVGAQIAWVSAFSYRP